MVAGQHPIFQPIMAAHGRILLQKDDAGAGNDLAFALIGFNEIGEAFQKRGLARSIPADQRQPVARPDMDVEVPEQPAFALDQAEVFVG